MLKMNTVEVLNLSGGHIAEVPCRLCEQCALRENKNFWVGGLGTVGELRHLCLSVLDSIKEVTASQFTVSVHDHFSGTEGGRKDDSLT